MFAGRTRSALKSKQTGEKSSPWLCFQVIILTCARWGSIYSAISGQVFTHSAASTFALLSVPPPWPPSSSVGSNRSLFVVKKPPRRDESPLETSTPRTFWWVKNILTENLLVSWNNGTRFGKKLLHCQIMSDWNQRINSRYAQSWPRIWKFCSMKKLHSVMYVYRALQ